MSWPRWSLPSYRMKCGYKPTADAAALSTQLQEAEIQLRCTAAQNGILAVRDASVALSAVRKTRELDYRGQGGVTRSQRNLQKAEMMKMFEIAMYNNARTALIHLGHMTKDAVEPFPPMTAKDTRRKETHLHRAKGDSRLFDGTAWYLQSGVTISPAVASSTLAPEGELNSDEDEPQLLVGTQTLKRSGFKRVPRTPKRLRDIAPGDVEVQSPESSSDSEQGSPSKPGGQGKGMGRKKGEPKKKKVDGWIWLEHLTKGQTLNDEKLGAYKAESERVQWFRAEAEMYRWLEQYEHKHVELMRVIERYRRDSVVWAGLADREEQVNDVTGTATYARMQAAMYKRLAYNAEIIFKAADSGAHHDWVSATTFDEMIMKMDGWRDIIFGWMDRMPFANHPLGPNGFSPRNPTRSNPAATCTWSNGWRPIDDQRALGITQLTLGRWWEHNKLPGHKPMMAGWGGKKATEWKPAHELINISLPTHIVDGFSIHCSSKNLTEWIQTVTPEEFDAVARNVFDKLFSTTAVNELRGQEVRDITLENAILYNLDVLFYIEFTRAIKKGDRAHAMFETIVRIRSFPPKLRELYLANWLVNLTGRLNGFKPVDLLQEHQNFWAKIIYNAKGTNKSWKWLSMISVCIFTLRHAMQTVQTSFKIPAYGVKHKTPPINEEVALIAEALRENSIQSYVEGRPVNDHVTPVCDLVKEGVLYADGRKVFHRFTRDARRPECGGFEVPEEEVLPSDQEEDENDPEQESLTEEDLRVDNEELLMEPQDLLEAAMKFVDEELIDSDREE
ncbi:hypothetical protein B0H16DRAFT_1706433 [Mycena metata]|uniref:DUF6589 domain-containing protein n=1 Tax=Mycena metata TaxID=1033252 RepID=A0AAD7DQR9_9AGAR|nr:hypothetical protein B0H16DRAFT_1706433 [Mycena metata]